MSALLQALLGGVAGAIAGSFIATLVLRWPAGRTLGGRSACDGCGRTLRAAELVPLLSHAWQRGRCRTCGARIDALHPGTEIAAATIGALALAVHPGWPGVAGALFGWLLLALALIDWRHFWLPNWLTLPLLLIGLVAGAAGMPPALTDRLVGGGVGWAGLVLIGGFYERLRGRAGLGGGDPKLLGAIGAWLGWAMLPQVLVGAGLAGLGVALMWRLRGRRVAATDRLPLGTLMAVAAWPLWLCHGSVTSL